MLSQPSNPYYENPYLCEMVTLYWIGPGDHIHTLHISDFRMTDGSLFHVLWRKWNNETSLYLNSHITESYRVAWCTIYMSFWSAGCHLYGNKVEHIKMALWCPLGNIITVGKRNAHLRRGYTPMPLATRPCAVSTRPWQKRVRIRVKNVTKAGTLGFYHIFVEHGW